MLFQKGRVTTKEQMGVPVLSDTLPMERTNHTHTEFGPKNPVLLKAV